MESAATIEITFKNGDTISFGKGEWDDYGYDGKAIMVKLKGTWIGIYNFENLAMRFDEIYSGDLGDKPKNPYDEAQELLHMRAYDERFGDVND